MGIKVVATQRGYFDQLIEPGQLFEVPSAKYISDRWMKRFDEKEDTGAKPVRARKKRKVSKVIEKEPETLTEAADQQIPDPDDWK